MRLETKRLILRPFTESDASDLFEYLKEPEVNCFACMKIADIEAAKKEAVERSKDSENYFAIELKAGGKVIGEIWAHEENMAPEGDNQDTYCPCWMLNKEYQGHGYMYEAAYAYINYIFEQRGARRIYVYTEDYNIACQKLSERLGMRREGLFKEFVSFIKDADGNPIYENTYQYAMLKREWDENVN